MSLLTFPRSAQAHPADGLAPQRPDAVVETYLAVLGARDPALRAHSEAVADRSFALARELGVARNRLQRLRRAALLHDVGKLAVPDAVLLKPGPLTASEAELVQSHSTWGHRIVLHADMLAEARWILHHHERPDGGGYPFGLRGDEIPLESRIILVADAYDAMTSDRPYSKAMAPQRALDEIAESAGSQFDGECVAALVACAMRERA
jgi:HD-GYP domain-containing protein (c-di-GMP phosphodiesterase class II)